MMPAAVLFRDDVSLTGCLSCCECVCVYVCSSSATVILAHSPAAAAAASDAALFRIPAVFHSRPACRRRDIPDRAERAFAAALPQSVRIHRISRRPSVRMKISSADSWNSTTPTPTSSPTSARGCPLGMRACTRLHNYTIAASLMSVSVSVSVSVPWIPA